MPEITCDNGWGLSEEEGYTVLERITIIGVVKSTQRDKILSMKVKSVVYKG